MSSGDSRVCLGIFRGVLEQECLPVEGHTFHLNLDVDESITRCLVGEFVEFDKFCGQSLDFHSVPWVSLDKNLLGQWCSSKLLLSR